MSEQSETAPVFDGTDVSVDPAQLEDGTTADVPATSDPEQNWGREHKFLIEVANLPKGFPGIACNPSGARG